jgi:hypothetical protein
MRIALPAVGRSDNPALVVGVEGVFGLSTLDDKRGMFELRRSVG